jgi:hypothetical protein
VIRWLCARWAAFRRWLDDPPIPFSRRDYGGMGWPKDDDD